MRYIYNEQTQAQNIAKIRLFIPVYNLLSYYGRLQDTKIGQFYILLDHAKLQSEYFNNYCNTAIDCNGIF